MTKKINSCYRCQPYIKQHITTDDNQDLVRAICIFGDAVDSCDNLSEEAKNEIVGILNAIIGGYPSTILVSSIFNSFSIIVRKHIFNIKKGEDLWNKIEIIAKNKDIT